MHQSRQRTHVKLPILIYHRVLQDLVMPDNMCEMVYALPLSRFEHHMSTLSSQGVRTVSFADIDLLAGDPRPNRSDRLLMLTFDDGTVDHYDHVFPVLLKHHLKGVFFIVTARIGQPGYMTWAHLEEMKRGGMEIQSHSHSHPFLPQLPDAEVEHQLGHSKELLQRHLGTPITCLAIPNGFYNRRTLKIAKRVGYRYVCTSRWGIARIQGTTTVCKRISIQNQSGDQFLQAALDLRDVYFLRQRLLRLPLYLGKRVLGPTRYAAARRWLLTRRPFASPRATHAHSHPHARLEQ